MRIVSKFHDISNLLGVGACSKIVMTVNPGQCKAFPAVRPCFRLLHPKSANGYGSMKPLHEFISGTMNFHSASCTFQVSSGFQSFSHSYYVKYCTQSKHGGE